MNTATQDELSKQHCVPCEGGIPAVSREDAVATLRNLDGWKLADDGQRISKKWKAKDFLSAIDLFNKVAAIAEQEDHHPDLHLEGYRNVTITLWTHAVGGLTENDFVLAAKINQIPVQVKTS